MSITDLPRPRFRYRLRSLCATIGVVAVVLGVIVAPTDHFAAALIACSILGFELFALYLILVVTPNSMILRRLRRTCPLCQQPSMACRALVLFLPPLFSVHRCENCGMTFERTPCRGWRVWISPDQIAPSFSLSCDILAPVAEPERVTDETGLWPRPRVQVYLSRRNVEVESL
jgi:hypothetical protein